MGFILSRLAWHDGRFLITGSQHASQCHLEIGTHCFLSNYQGILLLLEDMLGGQIMFLICICLSMYLEQTRLRAHRFLRHQPARNGKDNCLKQAFS